MATFSDFYKRKSKCVLGKRLYQGQGLENIFRKESDSKCFRLANYMVSVTITQLCYCSRQAAIDNNTSVNSHDVFQ